MGVNAGFIDNRYSLKKCSHCQEWKELSEFPKDKSSKDGFHHTCRKCRSGTRKLAYLKKVGRPLLKDLPINFENVGKKRCSRCHEWKNPSEFAKCKTNKDGLQSHCKQCNKAYRKYAPPKPPEIRGDVWLLDPVTGGISKRCGTCQIIKPIGEFNKSKSNRDGYQARCRECEKAHYQKNVENVSATHKRYYKENKDYFRNIHTRYRENNKEKISEQSKEYYQSIKDRYKEKYKENKEEILEKRKEYYLKNKEKMNLKSRKYYRAHLEIQKEKARQYAVSPKGRLISKLRSYKRKDLGYKPINSMFSGAAFHHMHLLINGEVDTSIGIYIPYNLHRSVFHNRYTGQGMREINKAALVWLSEQAII